MNTPIQIKTFRSTSLREALQTIRNEFGPDAAVLETKSIRGGLLGLGRNRIEVIATNRLQDPDPTIAQPNVSELPFTDSDGDDRESITDERPNSHADEESFERAPSKQPIAQDSIGRSSIPSIDGGSSNATRRLSKKNESILTEVYNELLTAHIDRTIAMQWIAAARDSFAPVVPLDRWMVRATIAHWIGGFASIATPMDVHLPRQQRIAMIGPTGVGKTTTLLKIAAAIGLEHNLPIGIMTVDSHRVGSNQLLEKHAQLMNWPIVPIESADQLRHGFERLAPCSLVFIDTPGCSPGDRDGLARLDEMLRVAAPSLRQLVLSSTSSGPSFDRAYQWFESLEPNQLVLTKLDESDGMGQLFPSILKTKTPLSFFSTGPNIPRDLNQATAVRFSQWVLGEM